MTITIKSETTNGNLIVYLMNSNGAKILVLKDSDERSCALVSGKTYRFEWHVWNNAAASYKIEASVLPENDGFMPFHWEKSYDESHEDIGGFYFTV